MISLGLLKRFYPDDRADTTQVFYAWVRRWVSPQTQLLNLGAGKATRLGIRAFRGEVARVVGADVDPVVLTNDELDEAHVIHGRMLPFEDEAFDVVVSDYVLEHVEEPRPFLEEAHRVLKRGGSFFFRTPNRYHYVSLIAAATPLWFHRLVANRARGLAAECIDQYDTHYRMNTCRVLDRLGREVGFGERELVLHEAHPAYLLFSTPGFLAGVAYERLVNRYELLASLRANILGRFVKQSC